MTTDQHYDPDKTDTPNGAVPTEAETRPKPKPKRDRTRLSLDLTPRAHAELVELAGWWGATLHQTITRCVELGAPLPTRSKTPRTGWPDLPADKRPRARRWVGAPRAGPDPGRPEADVSIRPNRSDPVTTALMGEQGPASLAWERRMRGGRAARPRNHSTSRARLPCATIPTGDHGEARPNRSVGDQL